jgi:hypothetical protein
MSVLGGRGGRPDDWSTPHARARARASERLDGPIDPAEGRWLDEHLADCPACASAAAEYAAERFQLQALRDQLILPPRDLWARTAASIEREARNRTGPGFERSRRTLLAPFALLTGALVVAVAIGTLFSSRQPIGPATTAPAASGPIVAFTQLPPAPTPIVVGSREVAYLDIGPDGRVRLVKTNISEVCPKAAGVCATTKPSESRSLSPVSSPATVFGSDDAPLVIVGDSNAGSSVYVVALPTDEPGPTPPPVYPTQTPVPLPPTPPPSAGNVTPTPSLPTPSSPGDTPPPSVTPPSPTPIPSGTIEIARGVEVVDTTAAYAPDGSAFAFTARPADGSHGPDIYLWKVGDTEALPVTTDHRSVFGSWAGETIVGSSVTTGPNGITSNPSAFALEPDSGEIVALPQTGLAWRPAVDPTEGSAVYWAGTLEPTEDGLGWTTDEGRLVLGRWGIDRDTAASPSDGPSPTQLTGDQRTERAETTLADGPITDWDARWDDTGTRLAVWIADRSDPSVGRLSLYVVDPFDGRIDLVNPPLLHEPALAGFSMADGRVAWAAPVGNSGKASHVKVLAWTDDGFGQVETAPGDFLLVR